MFWTIPENTPVSVVIAASICCRDPSICRVQTGTTSLAKRRWLFK